MELVAIVPALPSVAVRLLIKKSAPEYGMLDFIRKFSSVVKDTCEYENEQEVIASIKEKVIGPRLKRSARTAAKPIRSLRVHWNRQRAKPPLRYLSKCSG